MFDKLEKMTYDNLSELLFIIESSRQSVQSFLLNVEDVCDPSNAPHLKRVERLGELRGSIQKEMWLREGSVKPADEPIGE